jgi:uncharacterized membrane protein
LRAITTVATLPKAHIDSFILIDPLRLFDRAVRRIKGMSNNAANERNGNDQGERNISAELKPPQQQAQKNVETIIRLEERAMHSRTPAIRIAGAVNRFAGSPSFILFHVFWFGAWILVNLRVLPIVAPFDPLPFSFLTLIVSLEAIFLSLLVLMAQNRMTKEADKRAHLDLQINMLAEQQGTIILSLLQRICKRLDIEGESDEITREMLEETDVHRLAEHLEEKLPG